MTLNEVSAFYLSLSFFLSRLLSGAKQALIFADAAIGLGACLTAETVSENT